MIKICFYNLNSYSIFNPKSKAPIGGTEIQLFNITSYLSGKETFEIFFITGDWGQEKLEIYGNIKVLKSINFKKSPLNYLMAPWRIWAVLKKTNADIYIASSAGIEIGIIAFFCKLNKKKFIYRTAHDIDCTDEFIQSKGLAGLSYKFGLENASTVVTQNRRNREMLKKNHNIKAIIIKNSFNIPRQKMIGKKNYILWVSRGDKWKNPELFLRIVNKFPKYRFIMICPRQKYEDAFFEEISQKAKKFKNLTFIEKVPFAKIQKYFNEAKLFIGTSDAEGFPNTYLQACMGYTPVVSYKVNPDNFINQNNIGYCADGNFEKMLCQIKKLLTDKKDWQEKSKNSFEYLKKNHDIRKNGPKWQELIYNLAKK